MKKSLVFYDLRIELEVKLAAEAMDNLGNADFHALDSLIKTSLKENIKNGLNIINQTYARMHNLP